MNVLRIITISFYLALITLTVGSTSCSIASEKQSRGLYYDGNRQSTVRELYPVGYQRSTVKNIYDVGNMKYSAANWKNTQKYKKTAYQSQTKTISIESTMRPDDREYIDGLCNDCHDLKRVFLKRGSTGTWKRILNQEQHQEIGLEYEEINRLLQIFAKYLKN